MLDTPRSDGDAPRYFGVFPAIVVDLIDPESLGRVALKFPFLGRAGEHVRAWGTLLSPYADDDQGLLILPEPGSQVVVGFEAGLLERPYVLGAAWNGKASLPSPPAEANNLRLLRTRAGSVLEFDDTAGAPRVTLALRSGLRLILDDGASEVRLVHANGSRITFASSGEVTISAVAGVTIDAPAGPTVNAPTSSFSGSVDCKPLTATSITSPLYSPGAGNIW